MKELCLLMIILVAFVAPLANAFDLNSTEGMLAMCKSNGPGHEYCLGFISGTAGMMEQVGLGTSGQFRGAFGMCVSMPYPTGDAEVAAFITWADRNPQEWATPSAVGVMTALAEAWRCAEQR
jgi:hypothetical protein